MGRRFGQHFLARQSILDQIAAEACAEGDPLVIEIGPGRGALTASLIERARHVVAIEIDPVLVLYLRQRFTPAIEEGRFTLVEGDVLKTDLGQWGAGPIVGNLPYYISTPILERVFATQSWPRGVFLVQAEVAARLAASPGTRDYGYLSVLAQMHAHVKRLIEVPAAAFKPPPKVESAVVGFEPRDAAAEFGISDPASFLRFASACFRQKRKTLRNNLVPAYGHEIADALPEGRKRAEQLGIAELADIWGRVTLAHR